MINTMGKIKYDVINVITGKQEPYTGSFKNEFESNEWYKNHGKWFESQGRKLIKVNF